MNDLPIMQEGEGVLLFHPHMPARGKAAVAEVLAGRWLGQGPRVDEFELRFRRQFGLPGACIATGSGTDALHLAYLLAGIQPGDEVLVPLFTCTATSIPLLYIGAKPVFVDVDPRTMNVSVDDMRRRITSRTKAICVVHYGGLPCDMNEIEELAAEHGIPVIEDAAHALGAVYDSTPIGGYSPFTIFSFQAIKSLTTGDGGMLCVDGELAAKAKRLRWFGIDREKKQSGIWENDITEVGYKYQLTDIGAALGLAALEEFEATLAYRRLLYRTYVEGLAGIPGITVVDDFHPLKRHACWLLTVLVDRRQALQKKLREHGIESGQTHYRNDRYTIFNRGEGVVRGRYPAMDTVEDHYLILPLHTHVRPADVERICTLIREGW